MGGRERTTDMRLEVLVTTMHQKDIGKYREMNLQTDAVMANQTDENSYLEQKENGHAVKLISTDTRGLSRNRNIALAFCTGDLLLFSDDDVIFENGYERLVLEEFHNHPEADAIRFDMKVTAIAKEKNVAQFKTPACFRRATRREVARHGVCGLVVRRDVLKRYCLHFNEEFGAGTDNYCGEDTIFMQHMINRKIGFYLSPVIIASIDKSGSTWFDGYHRKKFYINGKVLAAAYPRLAVLLALRSSVRFSRRVSSMGFVEILKCYLRGISDYLRGRDRLREYENCGKN